MLLELVFCYHLHRPTILLTEDGETIGGGGGETASIKVVVGGEKGVVMPTLCLAHVCFDDLGHVPLIYGIVCLFDS